MSWETSLALARCSSLRSVVHHSHCKGCQSIIIHTTRTSTRDQSSLGTNAVNVLGNWADSVPVLSSATQYVQESFSQSLKQGPNAQTFNTTACDFAVRSFTNAATIQDIYCILSVHHHSHHRGRHTKPTISQNKCSRYIGEMLLNKSNHSLLCGYR